MNFIEQYSMLTILIVGGVIRLTESDLITIFQILNSRLQIQFSISNFKS